MERSIRDVARIVGTTTRTLRHYDSVGLLSPSSVGHGGYRRYDDAALVRLQRILLLRQLGLRLPAIAAVIDGQHDDLAALRDHLERLRQEQSRIDRQIAAVELTIERREGGEEMTAEEMFDGFDHTRYRDEVVERWGDDAYTTGDRWWRSKSDDEKKRWMAEQKALAADWTDAASRSVDADGDEARALAERHVQWLDSVPGVPRGDDGRPLAEYVTGLGEMYVADPRFGANYGGDQGAAFVRDALARWAERRS